jgi:hypothetical protein
MQHDAPDTRIDLCPDCGRTFVVPALLDVVDEGLYLVLLQCRNCDRMAIGLHEDAEMEELDRRMDEAMQDLEAYADILEIARFIEDTDSFTRALDADLVLPEDF